MANVGYERQTEGYIIEGGAERKIDKMMRQRERDLEVQCFYKDHNSPHVSQLASEDNRMGISSRNVSAFSSKHYFPIKPFCSLHESQVIRLNYFLTTSHPECFFLLQTFIFKSM